MEQLMPLALPLLVYLVTGSIKKFKIIETLHAKVRKPVLRIIIAGFSFAAVFGNSVISGAPLDPTSIETFMQTLVVFLTSQGGYYMVKKDKEDTAVLETPQPIGIDSRIRRYKI